jgi:REP element-mobilizing transposase RayT/AraC-like DNA-binding protein
MARPLRIEYPGALYHVTSRGNARQKIFRNDRDRYYFLDLLRNIIERYAWICHAFCLMDTHYHLIIETPNGNLSKGMRQLNGMYTQKYNWRYKKTGHVFQGRYKAIIIEKDSYLLELSRYVVLNPIRAHMVEAPEDWKWSSYHGTAGIEPPPSFLTTDWVLGQFSRQKKRAHRLYRLFVREGINRQSPWNELTGQIFLGDTTFIAQVKPYTREKEIPRSQRYATRPPMKELFPGKVFKDRSARDARIYDAHIHHTYTMKEIADHLGVHYATVSRAVKRVGDKMHDCKT